MATKRNTKSTKAATKPKKAAAPKKSTTAKTSKAQPKSKTSKATTSKAKTAKAKTAKPKTAKAKTAKAKAPTQTGKAAAKPAVATPAAGKPKVPFKVGDKVVYPHHGAATIIKKERREFDGVKQDYFVLDLVTDQLTVKVPVSMALERGVRPVISKAQARKVFAIFREPPQEAGANWSRWYKLLTEKINSGDIYQVAEVVRDLTYAQQVKGISPALKRMLAKARLIIVSELRFSLGLSEDEAVKRLDRSLPKVEEPVEV